MRDRSATVAQRLTVLSRLQLGIEALYRVETQLDVETFLVDEETRRWSGVARAPREQLLISQGSDTDCDEVRIGLFLDRQVVSNLERNDPAHRLDQDNFADFCLAVEGVSHFIYVAVCAAANRGVSALELELQAEVDKFACCLLVTGGEGSAYCGPRDSREARELTARLYQEVTFADDLDGDEHDRYRVANLEARRYAETLWRTFGARDRLADMLPELRRFYRLGLEDKLGHIARVSA